jgi:Icc-related predicted phosphoesterase
MTSLKCVVLSDTHGHHRRVTVPDADVLIHCGDFCQRGTMSEVKDFVEWLTEQPHKHIIVIPGNHDKPAEKKTGKVLSLFNNSNMHLLLNQEVVIEGVKFWGSPITPTFFDWSFMRDRGAPIQMVWERIPDDVDVLITHGPPYGHGDLAPAYRTVHPKVAGCLDLLNRIREIKAKSSWKHPRVHCFGHIHAGHGATESDQFANMTFINAAICTEEYRPTNSPIGFQITVSPGG